MPHSKEIKVLIGSSLRPGKDSRLFCTPLSSPGNAAASSGSELRRNSLLRTISFFKFCSVIYLWSQISQILKVHGPCGCSTVVEIFFSCFCYLSLKISLRLKRVVQNSCTKALNETISSNLLGLQQEKRCLLVHRESILRENSCITWDFSDHLYYSIVRVLRVCVLFFKLYFSISVYTHYYFELVLGVRHTG